MVFAIRGVQELKAILYQQAKTSRLPLLNVAIEVQYMCFVNPLSDGNHESAPRLIIAAS